MALSADDVEAMGGEELFKLLCVDLFATSICLRSTRAFLGVYPDLNQADEMALPSFLILNYCGGGTTTTVPPPEPVLPLEPGAPWLPVAPVSPVFP